MGTIKIEPARSPAPARVVLIDGEDRQIGTAEKMQAHRLGLLHRAVSVFVFNSRGHLLLQRRSSHKYHSGGLWSNTACTHPDVAESANEAAGRCLRSEMGLCCALAGQSRLGYRCAVGDGMVEHEIDTIFCGRYEGKVHPNAQEVDDYRWVAWQALHDDIRDHPFLYTGWFRLLVRALQFQGENSRLSHGPDHASLPPCSISTKMEPVEWLDVR